MTMRTATLVLLAALPLGCSGNPKPPPVAPADSSTQAAAFGAGSATPAAPKTADVVEPPPPPPPPPVDIVTITVVSAEVEGKMPDGEDWDAKVPSALGGIPAPITGYLEQHPELLDTATFLGVPVDSPKLEELAAKSPGADPMVILEVGGKIFRTPVRPRQFNPVWDFPLTFLYGQREKLVGVPRDASVQIHVVDYDGPHLYDTIGSMLVGLPELTTGKLRTLGPFGSVKKLVLKVDVVPLPDPTPMPSSVRLAVPGSAAWTDTGVDLVAGQRVSIEAADEVCSKGGDVNRCSGPEGQRKSSSYNVTGFDKLGHAALIGAVGDTRFAVRRGLQFVAPSSGRLLLGINDKDVHDNRGSYAVRIEVEPLP